MAYIELEDLRRYLGLETAETTDDRLLRRAISAAQSYIESQTNRSFEATTATRYYDRSALDPWDNTVLHLDADLYACTTLTNGDTAGTPIVAANYWPLPRNDSPPYHTLKLKSTAGIYWEFDPDCLVSVLGVWGYSSTPPADIIEACTEIAAFAYKKKDSQVFDTTAMPEAGVIVIPAGMPASARLIIERYKRYV
jgi:hypothetical protein